MKTRPVKFLIIRASFDNSNARFFTRGTAQYCEGRCAWLLPPVQHGIYPPRGPGPSPPEGPVDQAEGGVAEALHDGVDDMTQPHRPCSNTEV